MRRSPALVVALCVLGLGCASSPTPPRVSEDGLVEQPTQGRGTLFVKPGRHVGDYDQIWVAQVGIDYARGQKRLTEAQENEIYHRLGDGLAIDMQRDAVAAADGPGPCTVKFGLFVTQLELFESSTLGSQVNYVESYGTVTLVMEFRDSQTDEPLVRYGQRRSLGSGTQEGRVEPDMHRLGLAIDAIMEDVGDQLAELVPQRTDSRAHLGCQGLLGRSNPTRPRDPGTR